jgi:hypothetical protein
MQIPPADEEASMHGKSQVMKGRSTIQLHKLAPNKSGNKLSVFLNGRQLVNHHLPFKWCLILFKHV